MARVTAILLLDLHARADGFVAGDAFGYVAARLTGAGHTVSQARMVASEAPDPAAFLEAIRERARASGAEVVVLARAWDRSLVDAVRRGLPAARLVRLTQGVRAAIDEVFDLVLDRAGLVALAARDAAPGAATFERTTAAQSDAWLAPAL